MENNDSTYPPRLIKFYSNSDYNRDAMMNQYLYLSVPYNLNDVLDSNHMMIDFSNITQEQHQKWARVDFYSDKNNYFRDYRHIFVLCKEQQYAFCSFSIEQNTFNPLMWGHYCNGSKGFTIVFNTVCLLKSINDKNKHKAKFYPINYKEKLSPIDVVKYGEFCSAIYSMITKIKDWEYENEWRLICQINEGSSFEVPQTDMNKKPINGIERRRYYDTNCIEKIILGVKFFNVDNCICKLPYQYLMTKEEDVIFLSYLIKYYNDKLYINCMDDANWEEQGLTLNIAIPIKIKQLSNSLFEIFNDANREPIRKI